MNIALLYGGRSGEHEVSINSAKGVYPPLCNLGHTIFLIAITLEGRWFLQKGQETKESTKKYEHIDDHLHTSENSDTKIQIGTTIQTDYPLTVVPGTGIFCEGEQLPLDVAFAVTHGFGGEDGNLQGLCLLANLPLCGCDTLGSAIGMHKQIASRLFSLEGIPTVPSLLVKEQDIQWLEGRADAPPSWLSMQRSITAINGTTLHIPTSGHQKTDATTKEHPNTTANLERWSQACLLLQKELGPSLFIKPEDSGSSLGVTALRSPAALSFKHAVLEAKKHSASVLVQTLIEPMDELECALLEAEDGTLIAAGPARVVDPGKMSNHFLSYAYKYAQVDSAYLQLPSMYAEKIEEQIRMYARQAFKAIAGGGYARVDFFVSGDTIYLNEINTSPGMTGKSHFPLLMKHAGYSMEQVLEILINLALKRKREEDQRTYRPPGA